MNPEDEPLARMFEGQPEWLTIPEVAALLRATPKTVYLWIKDGKLVAYKLPGKHMVLKADLWQWIRGSRIKPGEVDPDDSVADE